MYALLSLHLHCRPNKGLGKVNCNMRRQTFKFGDLVRFMLEVLPLMCVAGWYRVKCGVWGFGIYSHIHF